MASDDPRVLDAREYDVPFDAISEALSDLPADARLVLRNDFEPEPLYPVLERRGFTYSTIEEEGVWRVEIEHAE